MYQPSAFAEDRLEVQHGLIQANPLGTLILADGEGVTADLIPFVLYPGEGEFGTLRAHVARANPLLRKLMGEPSCLVLFRAADAYISPSWYASKTSTHKVVPTWNYAMVQVRGKAQLVDDAAWLRRQLDDLTASQEGRMPQPWRPWQPADAPPDFIAANMKAILGVELPIAEIVGKWKVSQNRLPEDQRGVVEGLLAQQPPATEMAGMVRARFKDGD